MISKIGDFRSWTRGDKILAIGVLVALMIGLATLLGSGGSEAENGSVAVSGETRDIHVDNSQGADADQIYKDNQALHERVRVLELEKRDLEHELQNASGADANRLRNQLDAVNAQLADKDRLFEKLEEEKRIAQARLTIEIVKHHPNQKLWDAKKAIADGRMDDVKAIFEGISNEADGLKAVAEFELGVMAHNEFRFEDALAHYQRAVDVAPNGQRLNKLALVLYNLGRYAEAEEIYNRSGEAVVEEYGEGSKEHATHLNNLAGVLEAQDRYKEAEELYIRAIEIDKATIGETHPSYATDVHNLAVILAHQERYEEAEGLMLQALEIFRATLPEGHEYIASSEHSLAEIRAKMAGD